MKKNPVVHFEMPAEDTKRMADFYTKVFGWHTQMMGADMGNYVVAMTTDTDKTTMRPTTPGAINGGFFKKSEENVHPSVVIGVEDIKQHIKKVTEAGGKVLGEPMDIPGVGWYVSFLDTEGNKVSLLQPHM
jgi:predicted enzyme related to lactoylglutathione lyase